MNITLLFSDSLARRSVEMVARQNGYEKLRLGRALNVAPPEGREYGAISASTCSSFKKETVSVMTAGRISDRVGRAKSRDHA
ncbi:MAG: hypothetical protein LZF60_260012 [Nitrospira sp.]|nr:MAG: hypothetical protein LZF60_260012 [Nitrospira sp.]